MAALTASPGWTRTACALPLMSWAQVSCHRPGDTAQRCSAHTTEPPSRLLDAKGRCWGCCPSLGQAGKGSCGAQPASLGLLLDVPTSRRGGERWELQHPCCVTRFGPECTRFYQQPCFPIIHHPKNLVAQTLFLPLHWSSPLPMSEQQLFLFSFSWLTQIVWTELTSLEIDRILYQCN